MLGRAQTQEATTHDRETLERVATVGGTDVTDKDFIKLKRLLKARGVSDTQLNTCAGVQHLRLLGMKLGACHANSNSLDLIPDRGAGRPQQSKGRHRGGHRRSVTSWTTRRALLFREQRR